MRDVQRQYLRGHQSPPPHPPNLVLRVRGVGHIGIGLVLPKDPGQLEDNAAHSDYRIEFSYLELVCELIKVIVW
jgi:hypothetical protein